MFMEFNNNTTGAIIKMKSVKHMTSRGDKRGLEPNLWTSVKNVIADMLQNLQDFFYGWFSWYYNSIFNVFFSFLLICWSIDMIHHITNTLLFTSGVNGPIRFLIITITWSLKKKTLTGIVRVNEILFAYMVKCLWNTPLIAKSFLYTRAMVISIIYFLFGCSE